MPGSARASRAGDEALVIALISRQSSFRRVAETSTRGRLRYPELGSALLSVQVIQLTNALYHLNVSCRSESHARAAGFHYFISACKLGCFKHSIRQWQLVVHYTSDGYGPPVRYTALALQHELPIASQDKHFDIVPGTANFLVKGRKNISRRRRERRR